MLRTTVENKYSDKLEDYKNLVNILRSKSKGYIPKKSKVLSADYVKMFVNDAPDKIYLSTKVYITPKNCVSFVYKYMVCIYYKNQIKMCLYCIGDLCIYLYW